MKRSKVRKNRVKFDRTEIKLENFQKNLRKNFIKGTRNTFYRYIPGKSGSPPPRDLYYIFQTGYSPRYAKELQRQGRDVKAYNYFTVISKLNEFTPAKVRDEIDKIINEYTKEPSKFTENLSADSDQQDQRIKSITVNFVQ